VNDREPKPSELRRFILAKPILDYAKLQPGKRANDAIHAAAKQLVP